MEILLIIAVVVIISIVSSVGKKKPNRSSEDAPARPKMSDIQRAFMMADDPDTPPRRVPPAKQPISSNPAAAKQTVKARERLSARTIETTPAIANMGKYANIDLNTFHTQNTDMEEKPIMVIRQQKGTLRLFEDKNDFMRAVIYSEILTRRSR